MGKAGRKVSAQRRGIKAEDDLSPALLFLLVTMPWVGEGGDKGKGGDGDKDGNTIRRAVPRLVSDSRDMGNDFRNAVNGKGLGGEHRKGISSAVLPEP